MMMHGVDRTLSTPYQKGDAMPKSYYVEPCIGFYRNKQELEYGFHIEKPLPTVLEDCVAYCHDYGRKFNQPQVYARFTVLSPSRKKFIAMLFLEVDVDLSQKGTHDEPSRPY
jgi:hypothetical protein